jgi:hypothetical protein
MRTFVAWLFAGAILTASASYVLRPQGPRTSPIVDVLEPSADAPPTIPDAVVQPVPVEDPRSWCEPVDSLPCFDDHPCPPTADGTPRVCVREWWVPHSEAKVCAVAMPTRRVQRWRAQRLRVLVDEICKRSDGCRPRQLHAYLSAIILRESSWRPYAVHRLRGDREANHVAWQRRADRYVDSPAHDEPWRWQGYGYYGQNSSTWLATWDASAVPEVLCGEVESTLVHLRAARKRWRRLSGGVECAGETYRGEADAPSWYDISRVNAGSDACPGPRRTQEGFARRAKSQGLNPAGRVTLPMLGRPVPRAEQGTFAHRLRARMDRLHPAP